MRRIKEGDSQEIGRLHLNSKNLNLFLEHFHQTIHGTPMMGVICDIFRHAASWPCVKNYSVQLLLDDAWNIFVLAKV